MKPHIRLTVLLLLGGVVLLLQHQRQGLMATECSTDAQCSAPDGACDLTSSTCVQCVQNGDRPETSSDCCSGYTDPNTNLCANQTTCYGCSNDASCATCSGKPACDQSNGGCVSCVQDGDSAQTGSDCCGGFLNYSTGVCETCYTCFSPSDCSNCGTTCDGSNMTCVDCVQSGDYAWMQSDCCSQFGDWDNGYYYCE